MKRVVFPGSFDPPTYGHINIIERAIDIFDELYVVVASNPRKNYAFTAEQRCDMMKRLCEGYPRVLVQIWDSLVVEFAVQIGAKVLIRGIRALTDFSYEFELSMMNRGLNSDIETLFMPTDPKYFVLRSSVIRELVHLKGDISSMVPEKIIEEVRNQFSKNY